MPSFSLAEKLQTASPEIISKVKAVQEALAEYKTALRDDSVLTWSFAVGHMGNMSLREVVFEILLTRYLFEYTEYVQIAQNMVRILQQKGMEITTDILRNWLLPLAKIQAIKVSNLPKTWPWL